MIKFLKKADHFLIGYDLDNVILIRHENDWGFDYLPRLGYDSQKIFYQTDDLRAFASKVKRELLNPLRKSIWKNPSITLASSNPLSHDVAIYLYQFCKMIGGVNISLVHVDSVIEFLKKPHYKMIQSHYMIFKKGNTYEVREKKFKII